MMSRLPSSEKLTLIKRAKTGEPIARLCREARVSRTIFYRWLKRYDASGPRAKKSALKSKQPRGSSHWRAIPGIGEEILSLVLGYPQWGSARIAQKLADIRSGRPSLGNHGVYNFLKHNNLNLFEQRLAYAKIQRQPVQPQPASFLDRVRLVWEQFIPSLAPAPPPFGRRSKLFSVLKIFSVSAILSFLLGFGTLSWIRLLGAQTPASAIGLIFATLALSMGSIFFLYSLKYYLSLAIVLSFSQSESTGNIEQSTNGVKGLLSLILGLGKGRAERGKRIIGLEPSLEHIKLERYPKISVHIPLYNEKNVVERLLSAVTSFDYPGDYEVIIADDSTDETTTIINDYIKKSTKGGKGIKGDGYTLTEAEIRPGVVIKHLHRTSRAGFKGGALRLALSVCDPRAEFVTVFDADFVPYPDTLELFLKYFQATAGTLDFRAQSSKLKAESKETLSLKPLALSSNIAAVQGYQWHVLNKSENWITRGVRSEYAGSYVIERSGSEIYSGIKQISGAVYMIRRDVLEEVGWETSITEDFQLTLKLYEKGYKVVYTPYIQAPAECVSTLKRLIRQRMRWAEGHSNNIRRMFGRLMFGRWEETLSNSGKTPITNYDLPITKERRFVKSPLTLSEKLEFLYLSPYYLQSFFFLIGTFSWLISETIFAARLPFWTSLWGWSLVLTNFLSLPLMNAVGLFLEESEERDYQGIASFVALSYVLVPFQAYAAIKGFLEKTEGPWFRTPKTGRITDIFTRGRFYRLIAGILPGRATPAIARMQANSASGLKLMEANSPYLGLATANSRFDSFRIRPKQRRWLGKVFVVSVVLLSILVNSFSLFIPTKVQATFSPGWYALWYDGWTYRKKLTIDNALVSGSSNLTNFPILVSYTDASLKTVGNGGRVQNSNGYDIIFTDTAGTKLDHEIERYTATTGEIQMWVRIPTLDYNDDTEIYIYYGNSSISSSQENITGVWDTNYKGVWHLKEDPSGTAPQMKDSTTNVNHGTSGGTMTSTDQVTAKVDGGLDFDGTDDYVNVGNPSSMQITGSFTVNAWIKTTATAQRAIVTKYNSNTGVGTPMYFNMESSGVLRFAVESETCTSEENEPKRDSSITVNDGIWHQVVAIFNASAQTLDIYIDGTLRNGALSSTAPSSMINCVDPWQIGRFDSNSGGTPFGYFQSLIDDVRISNVARSADWVSTSFNNQNNQGTGAGKFIKTLGSEETENEWQYRKKLTIDETKVSGSTNFNSFPALVSYTDVDLKTTANGGKVQNGSGYDIIFTTSDSVPVKLDHEIEKYTATTGEIVMWVRLATLNATIDTDFYIYYGNSSITTSQQNATGVWDTNFKGVWHLNEGDSTAADFYKDRTSNVNHGTLQDTDGDTIATTGKVDGAIDFVGNAVTGGDLDWIQAGTTGIFDGTGVVTVEAWIKQDNFNKYNSIIERQQSAAGWGFTTVSDAPAGRLRFTTAGVKDYFSTGAVADTLWHHVAVVLDASFDAHFYIDGAFDSTDLHTAGGNATTITVGIGSYYGRTVDSRHFDGIIDEVRVSNTTLSADWIATEYNNHNNQGTGAGKFIKTLGTEEQVPEMLVLLLPLALITPLIIRYLDGERKRKSLCFKFP